MFAPLAGSSAQAQQRLTLDQFRERFLAALHAHDPSITWTVESPDEITVNGSREGGTTYLGNAYARYHAFPDELDDILDRLVRLATAPDAGVVIAADQLMVIARPVGFDARGGSGAERLVRPFGGDLEALVAVNGSESIGYPPLNELQRVLDEDAAAIWARALANTPKVREPLVFKAVAPKFYLVECGSGMASTLLFDDAAWASPPLAALGPHPAVTVEMDKLLAVDGDDQQAVDKLRHVLRASDDLAISSHVFIRRDGAWTVLP